MSESSSEEKSNGNASKSSSSESGSEDGGVEIVSGTSSESDFSFEGKVKVTKREMPTRSRIKRKATEPKEPEPVADFRKKKKKKEKKEKTEDDSKSGDESSPVKSEKKKEKSKESKKKKSKPKKKKRKRKSYEESDSEEERASKRRKKATKEHETLRQIEEEERFAILVGFPPHEMTPLEKDFFPNYTEGYQHIYLRIRNLIVSSWKKDVTKMVKLEEVQKGVTEEYLSQIEPVFLFLMRHGYINTGVFTGWEEKRFSFRTESPKVLIIGAGAAGLSCASQLHQFGYRVTILEARNRLGGRCYSSKKLDITADMGAQIITGLVGNPLSVLTEQLQLRTHTISSNACLRTESGEIIDSQIDVKMEKLFNQLLDNVATFRNPKTDQSLGKAMEKILPSLGAFESGILDWYYANLEYACATDLEQLSLSHWDQDDPYDFSGEHLILKDGYYSMLEPLSKGLDIRYNKPIASIKYDGPGVEVTCEDGEVFSSNIAVVTLPLGVLKADNVTYLPALPQWKKEAINSLGYGILNKVAIRFEEVFWEQDNDWVGKVVTNGTRNKRGMNYLWWNYYKISQEPILISLCAGQCGYDVEGMEDKAIIDYCIKSLMKMYKLSTAPKVVSYEVTRWKSEKYTRGSYSYVAVGATGEDYERLAKTVTYNGKNKIFFGGEHTNRYWPATVAGAYQSGLREAEKVHSNFVIPKRSPFHVPRHVSEADQQHELNRRRLANEKKETKQKGAFRRGIAGKHADIASKSALAIKKERDLARSLETSGDFGSALSQTPSQYKSYDTIIKPFILKKPTFVKREMYQAPTQTSVEIDQYNRPNYPTPSVAWQGAPTTTYPHPSQGEEPYRPPQQWPPQQQQSSYPLPTPRPPTDYRPFPQVQETREQPWNAQKPLETQGKFPLPKKETPYAPPGGQESPHLDFDMSDDEKPVKTKTSSSGPKPPKPKASSREKKFKSQVAEIVVNRLSRYRAQVPDKEDFKYLSKAFTVKIVKSEKKKSGNYEMSTKKRLAIKKIIDEYFKTHKEFVRPPSKKIKK